MALYFLSSLRKLILWWFRSSKTTLLLTNFNKIYLSFSQNPFEPKHQLLNNTRGNAGIKVLKIQQEIIDYSQKNDDVYGNFEDKTK